tara:strand:+ start:388 stop:1191 length:804 start_codon:yes stop_codon:yes gene_type:complete
MNNLILIGIIIIIFLYLVKPNNSQIDYVPSQQEIQDPSYINKKQLIDDYPYPQISNTYKKLGNGQLLKPLNNLSDILPKGNNTLKMTRTNENISKQRIYLPDYYRKDRLNENPEGTEELKPFLNDKDKSENAWTDNNVSEHPKFYNSDIKDEITNIGEFFDENNQYNDKTSLNTNSLTTDSCYTDKNGNYFCEDNTRLQLIPPKLITNPKSCYALNEIGIYKDKNLNINDKDKVINGGLFYNNVNASQKQNEYWSSPIDNQIGNCIV